jgi:hypothetical protein
MRFAGRIRLLVTLLAGVLAAGHLTEAPALGAPKRPAPQMCGKLGRQGLCRRPQSRLPARPLVPAVAPFVSSARPAPARTQTPAPTSTPALPRFFASDSVWNTPLAPDAPIDVTSPQRMTAFRADISRQIQQRIGPWIEDRSNSTPIYVVGPDVPLSPVRIDKGGSVLRKPLAGVPIPPNAKAAHGVDAHMTIYQPSTDTMWEFWHMARDARGWHAGWGGGMRRVSESPGYYTPAAWEGLPDTMGWNWGSTASSLPIAAGMATLAELRRGRIDHALAINVPAPCADVFAWPAQRTDGTSREVACLPEGARLRLDPALDISKLHLPPVTRMLAEAAQRYGMIVRDRTKHATTFFAEDPTPTGQDPYRGPGGLYGGLTARQLITPFPWGSVQMLETKYCTHAPCLR